MVDFQRRNFDRIDPGGNKIGPFAGVQSLSGVRRQGRRILEGGHHTRPAPANAPSQDSVRTSFGADCCGERRAASVFPIRDRDARERERPVPGRRRRRAPGNGIKTGRANGTAAISIRSRLNFPISRDKETATGARLSYTCTDIDGVQSVQRSRRIVKRKLFAGSAGI